MHKLSHESIYFPFTRSQLISCICSASILFKIFWWLRWFFNLSQVVGRWSAIFGSQWTWFDCSEHSWDYSNWFFFVDRKLGIWCFNQLIWSFFYPWQLSFSLWFSLHHIQWQLFHTHWPSLFNISLFIYLSSRWGTLAFADVYCRSSLSWHDCRVWSNLFFLTRFPSWSRSSNWKFTFYKILWFSRGSSWILRYNHWRVGTILLGKLSCIQQVSIFLHTS